MYVCKYIGIYSTHNDGLSNTVLHKCTSYWYYIWQVLKKHVCC
jgi:hypothetical protein